MLAVTACGIPENSIEVKTSREAAAASCEQTGKCVKDPSGLVLYNSDLVTENFILKNPAQSPTLLAKLMNLVDEPKLLIMSGKLDPLIRGVRLVSESEVCDSPKGIDGINPTVSQLRAFKQGRYKACISYIGDGLFKRVYALPSIEVDTTAPEIAKDEMTKSVLTAASASLSWSKSSDNLTPESKLVYSVYLSNANALDSIDSVVAYGSLVPGILVGGTSYILNSLAADTDYNVAVTVTDEAGNRSLVGHTSFKTLRLDATVPTVTISSDRDPGPTNLTSVLLTIQFSEPVNGFTAAGVNVNGATKGQFTAIDLDTYTLGLSTTSSAVSAAIPAGSAKDAAGNNSLVSNTWSLVINGAVAAPVALPVPGVYTSAKSVELSSQTPGATIYYTLDNSTPTVESLVYSAPIFVGITTTIKALATAPLHNDSSVVSLPFTITGKVQVPSFSVVSGSYGPAQVVEIISPTPGATIYYTDDNTTPTRASSKYTGPIDVSTSRTIKGFAVLEGYDDSEPSTATYTINGSVAAPEASPAAGTYTTAQSVTLSTVTQDATIYYTLDGSVPTTESARYNAPIFVQVSQTIRAIAVKSNFISPALVEFPYVITGKVQAPTFSVATGSYGPAQTVEITSSTPDATIYYTIDGSTPTRESARYASPVVVSTSQVITALAVLTDWEDSEPSSANYTINGFVDPPSASIQPGVYTSPIELSLSATTSGASIFYTVDGSTPNSFSLLYSAPIFVQVSQTIKAIAVKANYIDSVPVEFSYTINGTVQKPEFSLPQGSYGHSQSVSMTTPTPNATIYYTTDGSEPTRSSTRYVGAIDLTSSKTIKAFAVFADWADSAVETAQYTINGPVANPVGDPAPATYNSIQSVRLLTIPADAQIYYTIDGSDPTTSASRFLYSDAITVGSSVAIKALATRGDYLDSEVVTFEYNILPAVTFTPDSITLTAGVASASITPSRTDVPIESCSITPSLPQGLDFNTSECSISGTPAYGGPAATYAVTPANAGGAGNAATITIAVNGIDAMGAYYFNGEPANGRVSVLDPYADKNVLLMNFDGANGSTNFMDTSISNRTVTRNGNAIISNAQSRFGGSSAYFDGSGSSLWIPADTAFDFNEDFTMEGWFYFLTANQSNGASVLFSSDVDDNIQLNSELNSNTIRYFSDSWSSFLTATLSSSLESRWVHLAVVRQAGTVTIYENGQAVASSNASKQYDVGGLYIGQQNPFRSNHWFNGYMDEIRVTKGLARYTSNFTPATSAFGEACYTAGVKRDCGRADYGCPATGYCSALAKYFINGVEHPGLNTTGTGISTVDNKQYVNGSPASGLVGGSDPHSDKIVLLMHMDGSNGSTGFTDSSASNLSITPNGNVTISTAESKFGGASAYFDGDSDYLRANYEMDWNADFTLEFWYRRSGPGTGIAPTLFEAGNIQGGVGGVHVYFYDNYLKNSNGISEGITSFNTPPQNEWSHVALVRNSGTNQMFLNGVSQGTSQLSFPVTNDVLTMGSAPNYGFHFNGNIDELRITKDVARYTSNFTPPTEPFGSACYSAGVARACTLTDYNCASTGYCGGLGKYFVNGVEHPGLNSSGTGISAADNKYYVNGSLAEGVAPDSKTVLMLHMDGYWGSREFTDSSIYQRSASVSGDTFIHGTNKFGGGSAYFDGSGDYLSFSSPSDFKLGTGDFTAELWFNAEQALWGYCSWCGTSDRPLLTTADPTDADGFLMLTSNYYSNTIRYLAGSNWGWWPIDRWYSDVSSGIWNHYAVSRQSGTTRVFLNGAQIESFGDSTDYTNVNQAIKVGGRSIGGQGFHGYIDEVRVTKGKARYTTNFSAENLVYNDNACYAAGTERACGLVDFGCPATGYCAGIAKYIIDGVEHPGLTSSGTGMSTVNNKYYVNGSLANGLVNEIDPHGDKTVLLMHMDGDDNSTSFIDSSSSGFSPELVGAPRIRTTQSRFGGASAYFNGTGDYGSSERLQFGPSSALTLGAQDFTIEAWFYQTGTSQDIPMPIEIGGPHSNSDAFGMWFHANSWDNPGFSSGYSSPYGLLGPATSLNRWTHAAWVRKDGNLTIFIDGIAGASAPLPNNLGGSGLRIGGGAYQNYYNYEGYIDELRITKGFARYTSNFTPPTAAFGGGVACYTAGEQRACTYVDYACSATGYCSGLAMYFVNGVEHPGLNSSGTGKSMVNNKYYVNGSLANGLVGEIDPHSDKTVLLMHMDGVDGETSFTDDSQIPKTMTGTGVSAIKTSLKRFGTGSAYISESAIQSAESASIDENENFTIEMWMYNLVPWVNYDGRQPAAIGIGSFILWLHDNIRGTFIHDGDEYLTQGYGVSPPPANQWSHVAVVRSSNVLTLFIDGTQREAITYSSAISGPIKIGGVYGPGGTNYSGYIDEIRITKGLARYTSNFEPPSAAFGGACYTDGEKRACTYAEYNCPATGYCLGMTMYYMDGVAQPGLDSTGTGTNDLDGKYYVNGQLANGQVAVNLDFEFGATGWNVTGGMGITNSEPPGGGLVPGGIQGSYYIGSNDDSTGSATSRIFTLPSNIDHISFLRAGGSGGGSGFYVKRASDDQVLCSAEDGTQSDEFFINTCTGLGSYGSTPVYIYIADNQSGGWSKVYVDDIKLRDQGNNNLTIPECFTDGVSRACTQQDWTNFNFSDQRSCALWGSSGQVIAGTVVFEALGLGSNEACFNTCKNIPEVKCITMYAIWAFGGGRCTCTSSPETYSYPGFYDMVTWTPQQ
jgi:hypothetical protein